MGKKVWIVLQQREGELHRMSWEAIAAGQKLAAAVDGSAEAVLLGSQGLDSLAAQVAKCRLSQIHVGGHSKLADYTPGAYINALVPAIEKAAPAFVILPHTYQTVDFLGLLAQRLGAALLSEVVGFEGTGDELIWRRGVLAGKMLARIRIQGEGTAVVSVQSGAYSGDDVEGGEAPVGELDTDLEAIQADREILGVEEVAGEHVDLSSAEYIVAVGRGVGSAEKMGVVEALAQALGAELGASRPVIDSGWLPRDRQIGSSGQTVAPKLYIAAGISGAIQHLVGMKGSTCIVAINKDSSAPIFGVAHYGIVADLHEVLPVLTAAIQEART
jgi:electron transfer flavoprotein alpha subunit